MKKCAEQDVFIRISDGLSVKPRLNCLLEKYMNDQESIEVNFELGKYYYHEEHNLVKAKTHLEIAKKGLKKGNQDIQDILDSIARLENQS